MEYCPNGLVYLFGDCPHAITGLERLERVQDSMLDPLDRVWINGMIYWMCMAYMRDPNTGNSILATKWESLELYQDPVVTTDTIQKHHRLLPPPVLPARPGGCAKSGRYLGREGNGNCPTRGSSNSLKEGI